MKPKDILGIAVRLLGLVFLYEGLRALPSAVVQFCAGVLGLHLEAMFGSLLEAGWPLLLAGWLLRGAPFLMRIAYPDTTCDTKSETQIVGAIGTEE